MDEQTRAGRGRPVPRIEPMPGQSPEYVLWLHEPTADSTRPLFTFDPERRAGDVVPEVIKLVQSELRPTQHQEAPTSGGRHRRPRRRWFSSGQTSGLVVIPRAV